MMYRVIGWNIQKLFVDESYPSMRQALEKYVEYTNLLGEPKYEVISKKQLEGGYELGYFRVELASRQNK